MQKRGKTALTLVGFAVMLAALLALMVSIGAGKDGFDIDEFFTYGLANSYQQPFLSTQTGSWISGKAFSDYLTAKGHAHEYLNVYENQIADVHPPLYYLFMHAVCSAFQNPPFTKWTGIGLNLFFFSLTQFGLLLLSARLLSDGEKLELTPPALLPGLLYGLSAGAASGVVFIRMYAMMTMWAVWLALALVELFIHGQTVWRMRALAAVLIAGFLTQYYFVILACMLCGVYFFARLARREFETAGRYRERGGRSAERHDSLVQNPLADARRAAIRRFSAGVGADWRGAGLLAAQKSGAGAETRRGVFPLGASGLRRVCAGDLGYFAV